MASFIWPPQGGSGGSGTVTQVGLVDGSTNPIFTVSGSPVTTSGNLTFTLNNENANTVFAGPSSGVPAQPTFRALVAADVPTLNQNTTGTAANITATSNSTLTTLSALSLPGSQVIGTVAAATSAVSVSGTNVVTNTNLAQMPTLTIKGNNTGGTANAADLTVAQVNAILPVFTATLNGSTPLSGGGTTNFLRADGTWASPGSGFTNPMTTLGDIIYENSTPAPTRLAGNITAVKQFLSQTGTGTVSAAPVWAALASGDIPNNAANTSGTASNITGTTNATITTLSALASVGTITTGTWSATTIATTKGGTGVTSVTTAPTASSFAGWDANSNMSANSFIEGYATTATAAGTTTLVVGSKQQQFFTGSTTQTVVMPVTSTLVLGQYFQITNNSTGAVTIQSSGANAIVVLPGGTQATITCILTSGTTAASWSYAVSYVNKTAGITNNYASSFFVQGNTWTTTSATFAAMSHSSGTATLTSRTSNGLTLAAMASSGLGITFTPASSTAVYQITVTTSDNADGNFHSYQLTDGTNIIAQANVAIPSPYLPHITLSGIYAPATASAVTVQIQGATNNGTASITSNIGIGSSVEWSVVQIK